MFDDELKPYSYRWVWILLAILAFAGAIFAYTVFKPEDQKDFVVRDSTATAPELLTNVNFEKTVIDCEEITYPDIRVMGNSNYTVYTVVLFAEGKAAFADE